MDTKYFNYYKNTVKYKIKDQRSFNVFWKPIDDFLRGSKTIYISADGVYNKININTIYNQNTDNYLIKDYFVKYISSSKDLITTGSEVTSGTSLLCIGDPAYDLTGPPDRPAKLTEAQRSHLNMNQISPLPGTKKEIQFIDSLLAGKNWQVESYLGKEALESQLKQDKSPRVIHLATHGFFMQDLDLSDIESQSGLNEFDKNPLFRSGLLFAGASNMHEGVENDGILTAYEAMNLYLDNTELIVLSACETALGDVKNGEGVYGLQRALVVAGAQKLIMSLWKVNDEATMQLMQLFYSNWANGDDMYESLQKAQIQMMNEHEEPYYWGAFIMIGK
jgi:CHAT domain-containing protein